MLNVYVIGCGGVGGYIVNMLPMCISSLTLDTLYMPESRIQKFLAEAGNTALPTCVSKLVLVEGDTFNARNAMRQGHGAGSKLLQRLEELDRSVIRRGYLHDMEISGVNAYVNPDNISDIIQENTSTASNDCYDVDRQRKGSYSVIFLCVDNLKTRYEVSAYAETLKNVLVINGGNQKTSGQVTVYERADGEALDPNLSELYPIKEEELDKRPDEIGCGEVAPKHDQIAVTNSMIADIMLALFNRWFRLGLNLTDKAGRKSRINEVLVDTVNFSMTRLYHPVSQKTNN